MAEQVVTLRITANAAGVPQVVQAVRAEVGGASAATQRFGEVSSSAGRQAEAAYTGVGSAVGRAAAAIGGLAAIKSFAGTFVEAADLQGRLEAQLERVSTSQAEYNAVLERTRSIADDAYVSINSVSEIYVQSIGPMRQLGRTSSDTLDLTEALSLSLVVSSASVDKQATAISSLSKIMQTGKVDMDGFMSIIATAPRFVEALESSLGKTRAELLEMVSAGTLSTASLTSVASELGVLREEVAAMPTELVDAGVRFRNEFQSWAAAVNQQLGLTQALVGGLDVLSSNIGPLVSTVTVLAAAWSITYVGGLVAARVAAAQKLTANVQLAASELALARAAEGAAAAQLSQTVTLNQTRVATEALAVAQARTAVATTALNTAQAANIGLMARAGSGLLALAGGPWGVALLAIGAVAAATYNAMEAERERQAEFEATVASTHAAADATDRLVASLSAIEGASPPSISSRLMEEANLIDLLAQRQQGLTAARERYQQVLAAEIAIQNALASSGQSLADPGFAEQADSVKDAAEEVRSLELAIERLQSQTGELARVNQDALLPVIETMIERYRELEAASSGGDWLDSARGLIDRLTASYEAGASELRVMEGAYLDAQGLAAQLAEDASKASNELQGFGKTASQVAQEQFAAWEAAATASGAYTAEQLAAEREKLDAYVRSVAAMDRAQAAAKARGKAEQEASRDANKAQREQEQATRKTAQASADLSRILDRQAIALGGPAAAAALQYRDSLTALLEIEQQLASTDSLSAEAVAGLATARSQAATEFTNSLDAIAKSSEEVTRTFEDVLSDLADTPFSRLISDIELVGAALDEELAKGGPRIAELTAALAQLHSSLGPGIVGATSEALRGMQSLTENGSKAFRAMQVAIDALALVQGISAILNQGAGEPMSAPFRMALMAAAIAPLIANLAGSIGSFGGASGFTDTAAQRQSVQGTGTVLGDLGADSESIVNSSEITAEATSELVGINRGMLRALIALQSGLDGASAMLARGAGQAGFSELPAAGAVGDVFLGGLFGGLATRALDPLNILGGSSRITDQGIVIMGDLLEGIVLGAYQEVQSRSWRFGSRRTSEQIVDVSGGLEAQFQLVVNSLVNTVRQGALALGLLPAEIEARLAAFELEVTRISLKDLTGEEQRAELLAVFSGMFDGITAQVVPFIAQYQRVGEGLGETLVRVATGVQVTQEALARLGFSLEAAGPEQFAAISEGLIELAGGIEEFISGMNSFVDDFAPEAQKFNILQNDLTRAFSEVGLTIPATRDGMWELMQSLDATTESGREQIATLLRLSGTAAAYYDMLESRREVELEEIEALQAHMSAMADYRAEVQSLRDELADTGMSELARELRDIDRWATDARASLHDAARAAGMQGAAEEDLGLVHQVAAQRAAEAIARLRDSAADLVAELYGTPLDTIESEIQRIERAQQDAQQSQLDGINAVGEAAENVYASQLSALQGIQAWLDGQALGDLSTLTPEQRLAEARRQFEATLVAAQAGDTDALESITGQADALLRIGRDYYASGEPYGDIEALVRNGLQGLVDRGPLGTPSVPGGVASIGGSGGISGAPVSPELQALYDRRDALLDEQLAAQRAETLRVLGGMIRELIQNTSEPLAEVAASISLNLTALAEELGINLDDLSTETAVSLVALARQLGVDVAELATNVGVELGALADRQSLLNDALDATLAEVPEEFRNQLDGPLEAIRSATSDADATSAVEAAEAAINGMPEGIRDLLAPYFAAIGPDEVVSELTTLRTINSTASDQLGVLRSIRGVLGRIAGDEVPEGEAPSYDVGTAYVPRTGMALIHQGEMILPAAVADFSRRSGLTLGAPPGGNSDAVVAELRALRAEQASAQALLAARLADVEAAQNRGSQSIVNEQRRAADIAQQRGR